MDQYLKMFKISMAAIIVFFFVRQLSSLSSRG